VDLRGAEIGYGCEARRIVKGVEVGRFGVPTAATAGELLALGFEGVRPFLDDAVFVEARLKGTVAVVVFGHVGDASYAEEILDLRVGELAHLTGEEAAALFADVGIVEAVGGAETFA